MQAIHLFDDVDYLDLERNDPDAAAIFFSACEAIDVILKRRADMDARDDEDQTLFVPIGEHHSDMGHHLLQMLIVRGLQRAGEELVCGVEYPLSKVSEDWGQGDPILYGVKEETLNSRTCMRSSYGIYCSTYANLMTKSQQQFLLEQEELPIYYVDAPRVVCEAGDESYLDFHHPKMRNIAESMSYKRSKKIEAADWLGIFLRNEYMVEEMREASVTHAARISLLFTGLGHLPTSSDISHSFCSGLGGGSGTLLCIYSLGEEESISIDIHHSCHVLEAMPKGKNVIEEYDSFSDACHAELFQGDTMTWISDKCQKLGLVEGVISPSILHNNTVRFLDKIEDTALKTEEIYLRRVMDVQRECMERGPVGLVGIFRDALVRHYTGFEDMASLREEIKVRVQENKIR